MNINIANGDTVDGYHDDALLNAFSFNNVFESKTAGGRKFKTCIDICYDYSMGVAKTNLIKQLQESAEENRIPCSHVVTSNLTYLNFPNNAIGTITHADPLHTMGYKGNVPVDQLFFRQPYFGFGVLPLSFAITSPTVCNEFLLSECLQSQ